MVNQKNIPQNQCLESQGPPPFVTRRVHRLDDGSLKIWSSRHHRKRLPAPETLLLGRIRKAFRECWLLFSDLNWWIGALFAIGSLFFIVGSAMTLGAVASIFEDGSPDVIFFLGSLPFTLAGFLQFYQAITTPPYPISSAKFEVRRIFGCRIGDLGWWSCFLQFMGTLLFNVCTFNGMRTGLNWIAEDVWIWVPNMSGSILFLLSGLLAFAETCHAYWRWQPGNLSWWVVFVNLLGCIGFLVSGILAVNISSVDAPIRLAFSNAFTLLGAVGFLVGSLLLLPEAATKTNEEVVTTE